MIFKIKPASKKQNKNKLANKKAQWRSHSDETFLPLKMLNLDEHNPLFGDIKGHNTAAIWITKQISESETTDFSLLFYFSLFIFTVLAE